MKNIHTLRLRYGLHWTGNFPPITQWAKNVIAIALILAASVSLYSTLQLQTAYASALLQSVNLQEDRDMLLACLNGQAVLETSQDEVFLCKLIPTKEHP
ncbi:MAG: hypothetical protein Q7S51_10275 [Gallionellaceae bacterium]|nr:hypothetical protein [Gallionellaceae bacterium]